MFGLDTNFLGYILMGVASAALIALTYAAINFAQEKTLLIKDEKVRVNVQRVLDAIGKAVNYTNQTFVDEMKKQGAFTKESAKEAFIRTRDLAEKMIDEEGRKVIEQTYNDYDAYIKSTIEELVKYNKELYKAEPEVVVVPTPEVVCPTEPVQEQVDDNTIDLPLVEEVAPVEEVVEEIPEEVAEPVVEPVEEVHELQEDPLEGLLGGEEFPNPMDDVSTPVEDVYPEEGNCEGFGGTNCFPTHSKE